MYQYIDVLKRTDAVAGAVLTKMEATAALSENLLCITFILLIGSKVGLETVLVSRKLLIAILACLLIVVLLRRGALLARLAGLLAHSGTN